MGIPTLISTVIICAALWLGYTWYRRWRKSAAWAAIHGVRKAAFRRKSPTTGTRARRVKLPNSDPPTFI